MTRMVAMSRFPSFPAEQPLIHGFRGFAREPMFDALRPTMAECMVLLRSKEFRGCRSRFGGRPLLPRWGRWPRRRDGTPLALLAEIHLSEVPRFEERESLPRGGVLQFWFDYKGLPTGQADGAMVAWLHDLGIVDRAMAFPSDLPEFARFRAVPVIPQRRMSIVAADHLGTLNLEFTDAELNEEVRSAVRKLRERAAEMAVGSAMPRDMDGYPTVEATRRDTWSAECPHQLLGHPTPLNGEEMVRGQRLLLQLDSDMGDEAPGWVWGDAGTLWFTIAPRDLAERNFERSRYSWAAN